MSLIRRLDHLLGRASSVLAVVAAICTLTIMSVMVIDVAVRSTTGSPISGAFDAVETLFVAIVFLGMAWAERDGKHVRVNLVTSRIPRLLARVLLIVGNSIALAIVAVLAVTTSGRAVTSVLIQEYRIGLTAFPIWPARIAIAIGLLALMFELARTVAWIAVDQHELLGDEAGEQSSAGLSAI